MLSGYNTLIDCILLIIFGGGVASIIFLLNKFFPPFKKFFDKLMKGDL